MAGNAEQRERKERRMSIIFDPADRGQNNAARGGAQAAPAEANIPASVRNAVELNSHGSAPSRWAHPSRP